MYVDIFNTDKKYSVIYADPPWSYKAWDKGGNGCALNHYGTMTKQDIFNLPVGDLAAKDCTLFLWVTFPCLEQGLETMRKWGFTYKTLGFCWVKRNKAFDKNIVKLSTQLSKGGMDAPTIAEKIKELLSSWFWGLGFWSRSNPEVCLIGVKGKPRRVSAAVHSVVDTPIEGHSKKPDVVRDRIKELCGGGNSIELFARQSADGWDCWGNEAPQSGECCQKLQEREGINNACDMQGNRQKHGQYCGISD